MSRLYQIIIQQTLDSTWEEWFAPMTVQVQPDGTTLLAGAIADQTALHSVLNKIRNLNLELLSVSYTNAPETPSPLEGQDETQ